MGNYKIRDGKLYVAVPNDVFKRLCDSKEKISNCALDCKIKAETTGLDVVESFTLYFVFLLRMDWKREAEIQMKSLVEKYFGKPRSETWATVNRYLLILKTAKLIDYDGSAYTGSDIICVQVLPVNKPFSLIACVNECLITYPKTKKSNTPFALHCLLNIKRAHTDNEWIPIEISQAKLAECLMVSMSNIRDSADLLFAGGFIRRDLTQYYTDTDGTVKAQCILYTVHDYDNPVDNTKIIVDIEQRKIERRKRKIHIAELKDLFQDFEQTPILLIGEYTRAIDVLCKKDSKMQRKLLNINEIKTVHEAKGFIEQYNKREIDNDMFVIISLPSNRTSARLQEMLLKFIENNARLPIVVLAANDDIIAPFLSRIRCCLKKSAVNVRTLRFEPVHKGFYAYEKRHHYYNYKSMLDHALNTCPELLAPTVTNPDGNAALYRVDNLISKLTGGKTYIDILSSLADVSDDIPSETKYLSLSLRRADLTQLTFDEYETAIKNSFAEES